MRSDGVRVLDGDVVVLSESEILVHLLHELSGVHLVRLSVFPHVAEPYELVCSRQEIILARVLFRGTPMVHLT